MTKRVWLRQEEQGESSRGQKLSMKAPVDPGLVLLAWNDPHNKKFRRVPILKNRRKILGPD